MEDRWFMDEVLGEPYTDPVMAEDGFMYDRGFIEMWFQQCQGELRSPTTLLPMGTQLFYPFMYYQMREAWARARGLVLPPKPKRYGAVEPCQSPPLSTSPPQPLLSDWLTDPHHFPPLSL
jgi:hypothetical protein